MLRADAHALRATVHVGAQGLSDQLVASLDDALRTHELVKVQLGRPLSTNGAFPRNRIALGNVVSTAWTRRKSKFSPQVTPAKRTTAMALMSVLR